MSISVTITDKEDISSSSSSKVLVSAGSRYLVANVSHRNGLKKVNYYEGHYSSTNDAIMSDMTFSSEAKHIFVC